MEIAGSFLDEEWESLNQIFSSGENLDFLHHYGAAGGVGCSDTPSPPSFLPSDQTNFCFISQESSEIDEALFLNIHGGGEDNTLAPPPPFFDTAYDHSTTYESKIMNFHSNAGFMLPDHDVVLEDFLRNNKGKNRPNLESGDSSSSQMKRKLSELAQVDDKSDVYPPQNPSKKSRNGQKNRRVQQKKGKKMMQDKNIDEEEIINGGNKQSCSSCSEDDDSNASQELNEEIKNSKTRASRGGSATDPQSLYARKRRERINERLKILQNLVPNGTKVDISTMLEEAVQYVKFLQLQIKLLSSDNMWMYAPLAYNGMDIGIYEKICPNMRL